VVTLSRKHITYFVAVDVLQFSTDFAQTHSTGRQKPQLRTLYPH